MKKVSTELFDLIKSLTTNEKAYFKRFAGMHKGADNSYFKLFEAIAEQDEYCEEKVKTSLKNEKLVGYFSRAKKYLFDKILESMRLYNADKRVQRQLWDRYEDAYFLFSRRQNKPALRLLKKIQKEAQISECWLVYVEALRLEMLIVHPSESMLEKTKALEQKIKDNLDNSYNMHHFILIDKMLNYYWNSQNPIKARVSYRELYDEYLANEDKNILQPSTVEARIYKLRSMGNYHKAFREFDLSYEKFKQLVHVFEEHPAILQKHFYLYFCALETLISADCDRFDQTSAALNLKKVNGYFLRKKSPVIKDEFLKSKILPKHYFNKIIYCFKFGLHQEALDVVEESITASKSTVHLTPKVNLQLLANMYFLVYIIHEQWEKALYWINYILTTNAKEHKFVLFNAQLWELFIHLALQNYQLLDSMLRNKIRTWQQEGVFVPYLQKIVKTIRKQMNQTYPEFWSEIGELALENAQKSNYQGVDTVYAFAQSHLQGRSFGVVRREMIEEYIKQQTA